MARQKALDDKKQIIDAAFAMMDETGIEGVSIRNIAKAVGVSSMTLYNYVRNVDDILKEILARSFNMLLRNVYVIMESEEWCGRLPMAVFARAYAKALFILTEEHPHICAYLIGPGMEKFRNDAELRSFYNIFDSFLLDVSDVVKNQELMWACRMYQSMLFSLIHEHISGSWVFTEYTFLEGIDLFIERIFPKGDVE